MWRFSAPVLAFCLLAFAATGVMAQAPAAPRAADGAALAWEHVKTSKDIETLKMFIEHYGRDNAFYARLAAMRIKQLETEAAAPPKLATPPPPPPPGTPAAPGTATADPAFQARGACRHDLLLWRRKASAAAFAVERGGGCGWTWGNTTIEEARQAALKYCRQQGPDCRIIEEHTKQPGDWSLSGACKDYLVKWRQKESIGAFAIERGGSCGWSFGFKSETEARERATVECRKHGADCRVIEVN